MTNSHRDTLRRPSHHPWPVQVRCGCGGREWQARHTGVGGGGGQRPVRLGRPARGRRGGAERGRFERQGGWRGGSGRRCGRHSWGAGVAATGAAGQRGRAVSHRGAGVAACDLGWAGGGVGGPGVSGGEGASGWERGVWWEAKGFVVTGGDWLRSIGDCATLLCIDVAHGWLQCTSHLVACRPAQATRHPRCFGIWRIGAGRKLTGSEEADGWARCYQLQLSPSNVCVTAASLSETARHARRVHPLALVLAMRSSMR